MIRGMDQPLQIRALREAAGMTQEGLAEAAGVSRSLLAQWESGARRPNTLRLAQVARALRVEPAQMFGASRGDALPVVGSISDGGRVVDSLIEPPHHIARPPQLCGQSVLALQVSDGSMMPLYERDSVVFVEPFSVDLDAAVGHVCVIDAAAGQSVRLLHRGDHPGEYNLIGVTPAAETRWNVPVIRAARVRLCLPPDLVQPI